MSRLKSTFSSGAAATAATHGSSRSPPRTSRRWPAARPDMHKYYHRDRQTFRENYYTAGGIQVAVAVAAGAEERRRLPGDQLRRELAARQRVVALAGRLLRAVEQRGHRLVAELHERLADRGHRRREVLGAGRVVDADDRDVFRDAQPGEPRGAVHLQRERVPRGEDRGRAVVAPQRVGQLRRSSSSSRQPLAFTRRLSQHSRLASRHACVNPDQRSWLLLTWYAPPM